MEEGVFLLDLRVRIVFQAVEWEAIPGSRDSVQTAWRHEHGVRW